MPMLWASSAHAEDLKEAVEGAATAATQATSGPPTILGLNLFEVLLLAAPPVLYLAFNIYRSQVNQQAKVRAIWHTALRCCRLLNNASALMDKDLQTSHHAPTAWQ